MPRRKMTNNDLQNRIQKNKRTPLKSGGGLMCSGKVINSCSTCDTRSVYLTGMENICAVSCLKIIISSICLCIMSTYKTNNKNTTSSG